MLALYRSGRQAEALARLPDGPRASSPRSSGSSRARSCRRLEQAILAAGSGARAPQAREAPKPAARPRPIARSSSRPTTLGRTGRAAALAVPLAAAEPPRELIVACVVDRRRDRRCDRGARRPRARTCAARGVAARTAAFASPAPGEDLVRLGAAAGRRLLLMDAGRAPLDGEAARRPRAGAVRRRARSSTPAARRATVPVVVPFGAARHDWAALELGAWVARATAAPLRLVGAAVRSRASRPRREPPARRRLADRAAHARASSPSRCSREPGRDGVMAARRGRRPARRRPLGALARRTASAAMRTRARRAPPAPTVLVRRGRARAGLRRPSRGRASAGRSRRARDDRASSPPARRSRGYRIESVVGRGGMGVVYRATDLSLERPVALKLIAPELAEDERFREPLPAASRGSPRRSSTRTSCPIYEAGEEDGQLYLAMRFVEGSDLQHACSSARAARRPSGRSRSSPRSPTRSTRRTGAASSTATSSPRNMLVDEGGHAYLTDFGLTKQRRRRLDGDRARSSARSTTSRPSRSGARRSTAAPTSTRWPACSTSASPARRPSAARPRRETLWAHMQEEPPPLPGHAALDPVLVKGLAKEREDRYASCAELIARRARRARPRTDRHRAGSSLPKGSCAVAAPSWAPACSS